MTVREYTFDRFRWALLSAEQKGARSVRETVMVAIEQWRKDYRLLPAWIPPPPISTTDGNLRGFRTDSAEQRKLAAGHGSQLPLIGSSEGIPAILCHGPAGQATPWQ